MRKGTEQQHEQGDEGHQDAQADAPREVVGLRAQPQAGDRDGSPAEQADEGHGRQQQAGERAVDPLAQLAAALGQRAEAHRRGAGTAPDEQPAVIGWVAAHLVYVRS